MNLRSIDLNLLVLLDALLDEAHVSRAARRVGLTQPAMSGALERCRILFRDPLLARTRGGMRLTERAQSLRAPLKSLLAGVEHLVDAPQVALSDLHRTVRLVMSDHPAPAVGPVLEQLRRTAPGISLIVRPWLGTVSMRETLLKGDADLSLAPMREAAAGIERHHVLDEQYVVVMRRDHPARASFDLDRWLAFPHVVVSGRGDPSTMVDMKLAELGLARQVGVVAAGFLMVPPMILASDLIALLPSLCIADSVRHSLAILAPPVALEGFPLHLAWHERRRGDAAVQHVATLLERSLKQRSRALRAGQE